MNKDFYWLNKESRDFLKKGYLLDGVTPEDRIKQIADRAQEILNIEGFSDKFFTYMAKGYFSLATPVWMNFGLERGLPISCVAENTWINTSCGGKIAKDICIGDLVLTHKNRFRPVTNIMPTKSKDDIWKVKVGTRMTNLYITGNHPVLTNLGWVKVEELDVDKHLIAVNGDLEYEPQNYVIDLKMFTDYKYVINNNTICKAIENTSEKSKKRNTSSEYVTYYSSPKEFVEIDESMAWALGVWFAEGSISVSNKKEPNGIRITVNDKDEEWVAEEWFRIMSDRFNLKGNIYKSEVKRNDKNNSWLNVNLNSRVIGSLFNSFGKGAKEKTLPEWLLNLPKEKLQKFLDGILLGDGSKKKSGANRLTLSNPKLLLQVYNIGLKLGHEMSLQMQEKAGVFATTSHVYTVIFRGYEISKNRHSSNAGIKFNDGLVYCPIKVLEKTEKIENVYDFTVEEDHSFSCSGVVVHNCYGIDIQDDTADILRASAEIGMLTKMGGGTAGYFGKIRHRGASIKNNGVSNGSVAMMKLFQTTTDTITQGQARRGYFAAYQDIEHLDIEEFLECRGEGSDIQDLALAVCISDNFMEKAESGDKQARKILTKVHKKRAESGFPYVFFSGNVERGKPQVYKDKKMTINHSQMCCEIIEYTDEFKTFVCCISSINVLHWDEIKETDAIETLTYFLDAVYTEFIQKAENIPFMEKAVKFAKEHRSIGVGVLGWHSLLQSKMIPFEGLEAMYLNGDIFKTLNKRTLKASKELAVLFGEPKMLEGYGERFTTRVAPAPTTSSSFILGQVSPSIEPILDNYFMKDLAKGKYVWRNPYLVKLLQEKEKDTTDVWNTILKHGGSVQHLKFLDDREKAVFKTFGETSQLEVIRQAAQRQKYIDQSQSLNLMIHPDTPLKEVNSLFYEAWRSGIKTLYYQRSVNMAQKVSRDLMVCSSCEA